MPTNFLPVAYRNPPTTIRLPVSAWRALPRAKALGGCAAARRRKKKRLAKARQFAIQHEVFRCDARDSFPDSWKITRKRLLRFGLKVDLFAIAKDQTSETVPLRFVSPFGALGNCVDGERLHRRQRRMDFKRHYPCIASGGSGSRDGEWSLRRLNSSPAGFPADWSLKKRHNPALRFAQRILEAMRLGSYLRDRQKRMEIKACCPGPAAGS